MPPTTLVTFFVVQSSRPGSTRSGENARWKSLPARRPLPVSRTGRPAPASCPDTSSTRARRGVPAGGASRSLAPPRRGSVRSGSRWRESGVGSAIEDRVGVARARRSRWSRRCDRPRRAARAPRTGRPRCSSRRGSARDAIRVDVDEERRACPRPRRCGRAARRRSRRRRWRVPLHRPGIVATSSCAIRSEAWPSP